MTLNFDTKNSVINYFVHPRNPDGLGSTYKGMEGDYKFMVMETSPERIRLRGIISGNSYILTPMPSDADWPPKWRPIRTVPRTWSSAPIRVW